MYRYELTRASRLDVVALPPLVVVMLNPSTADALIDDPTIRRLRGFADRWRCDGLIVANLFAYRTPYPYKLAQVEDAVGADNDEVLRRLSIEHEVVLFGWGANAPAEQVRRVERIFRHNTTLCFERTANGSPRHPLYVRSDKQPELYEAA